MGFTMIRVEDPRYKSFSSATEFFLVAIRSLLSWSIHGFRVLLRLFFHGVVMPWLLSSVTTMFSWMESWWKLRSLEQMFLLQHLQCLSLQFSFPLRRMGYLGTLTRTTMGTLMGTSMETSGLCSSQTWFIWYGWCVVIQLVSWRNDFLVSQVEIMIGCLLPFWSY